MASINKVILIGNIGATPEVRFTSTGEPVCTLSVATSDRFKNRNGEIQTATEWHKVVVFRRLAEIAIQYLRKGSCAYFEGQLKTRKWIDKNGSERYTTEVEAHELKLLDRLEAREHGFEPTSRNAINPPKQQHQKANDFDLDDVPF